MKPLIIILLVLIAIALLIFIGAYVCFRMAFYSPKRNNSESD